MTLSTSDSLWSKQYKTGHDYQLISSQAISRFLTHTNPSVPRTALDIGCGTGQMTRELYHRGYRVVGLDVSAEAITQAKTLTAVPDDQLIYMHTDIEREDLAQLPHVPYGLITCKLVYAFIKDKPAFLERVIQLLAPGGSFVVITPTPGSLPREKAKIAASEADMRLLKKMFLSSTSYDDGRMICFIGTKPLD